MDEKDMNPIYRCKGTSDMERMPLPLKPQQLFKEIIATFLHI